MVKSYSEICKPKTASFINLPVLITKMQTISVRKALLFGFLILLAMAVIIGGCTYGGKQSTVPQPSQTAPQEQPAPQPAPEPAPAPAPQPQSETPKPSVKTVYITVSGFVPEYQLVKVGDTVVWVNNDTAPHWPASAAHPTHTVYPEPGGCIGSKFDACKGLATGEQWNFTFNEKGTWAYHDHLKPTTRGRIVVE